MGEVMDLARCFKKTAQFSWKDGIFLNVSENLSLSLYRSFSQKKRSRVESTLMSVCVSVSRLISVWFTKKLSTEIIFCAVNSNERFAKWKRRKKERFLNFAEISILIRTNNAPWLMSKNGFSKWNSVPRGYESFFLFPLVLCQRFWKRYINVRTIFPNVLSPTREIIEIQF